MMMRQARLQLEGMVHWQVSTEELGGKKEENEY